MGIQRADKRSDLELVRLCNEGSAAEAERAFESLYKRHKDYVTRVARRFVRDNDAALDVLQDTFSYVLRKFPPSGQGLILTAQFTTFLYPVIKHSAITKLRKDNRFPASETREPDDLPAETPDTSGEFEGLLYGLSEEHREIVFMRFVDDLSLQEIADALGVPLGTVKSRLHLAIRKLRESPRTKMHFE
jgi:RNA polymerase sigma-70 factor (ECF subfamily)